LKFLGAGGQMNRSMSLLVFAGLCSLAASPEGEARLPNVLHGRLGAQENEKKPEKKVEPRVFSITPLGIAAGKAPVKLTLRGTLLDQAKDVKVAGSQGAARIVSKSKAPPPDKLAPEKFGDTQLEIELTLQGPVSGAVQISVVTAEGETPPRPLFVEGTLAVIKDKEGNEGFRQAQAINLPVAIDGRIERPRDVDVFRFEGKAGQKIIAEVFAARRGAALDPMLSLYDARGNLVTVTDARTDALDARIETTLRADGAYFLALIDAHDTGGALHVYWLAIR
jgi:YD repeat-containing protein